MSDKEYEKPEYEYPIHGLNWTAGVGQPAGIYWLDGECVIAAHHSHAEQYLLTIGAILVATLRFDPDPLERRHAGRHIQKVEPRELVYSRGSSEVNPALAGRDALEHRARR
jgi:hypothetical protein